MFAKPNNIMKIVIWWLILLLLLNSVFSSPQLEEEEHHPTSATLPRKQPVQHPELASGGSHAVETQLGSQKSEMDSGMEAQQPHEEPDGRSSLYKPEKQRLETDVSDQSLQEKGVEEHQGKRHEEDVREAEHEEVRAETEPQPGMTSSQDEAHQEGQLPQETGMKRQQRQMPPENEEQQSSGEGELTSEAPPQENHQRQDQLQYQDGDGVSQDQQQGEQEGTYTEEQEHAEEKVEGEEEDEDRLPPNLPTLRWGETATITKCCPPEEVLVRQTDGQPPTCQPVPADQRWRPLLLNGRLGRRVAPSARSALVSGNVSCAGQHFWLDSTAGERFELLTTGHLYMRRADALLAPLSFCADRLLSRPERPPEEGGPPTPLRAGRAARVCTLSLQERSSLLDEHTLWPACARRRCLRKCCPRGLKVRWHDQLCVPQTGEQPWRPGFWQQASNVTDFLTVAGNPPCRADDGSFRKVFALEPAYTDDDQFFLKEDGRLWVPRQEATIPLEDFCVDQVEYEHPQKPGVLIDYHAAIVCFGESSGSAAGARVSAATHLYRALLLVSALFLLATLLVYCAVPELRNLHGRCLLSHVAALLAAYGCNLAAQVEVVYSSMAACQVTALVMYFSFLAACFWLNAMSFDIWLTFSRIRSAAPNRSQTGRFVKYSLYCWCCPLVLTAVVITMQYAPDWLVPPENFIRPRLGEQSCWFPGSWEMLVYFHGPILVLMTANLGFFVLTAKNLLQTEKDTRMAGRQKRGTERFKIYVNLFVVMGITWIAEALSIHLGPKEIWLVTDVFNALQGFFIFLLFTLRQNTRSTIRRHFASSTLGRCCCKVTRLVPGLSSRKTTSSSAPGSSSSKMTAPPQQNGRQPSADPAASDDKGDTPV
ncbi:G-protein coupled receptor Mth2-like [Amphibalanus amphitrite]|uniref:G-protein coupled receptor Mth2-like n=1 Tax=Amphibalanus amphitrite TaxID=1232801 RepID=UPI001C92A226|nr:G-protein coupled receptor Mth2-like [Amphibalanus amphitrite]